MTTRAAEASRSADADTAHHREEAVMPTVRNNGQSPWTYLVGRETLRRSDTCLQRGQRRLFPHSDILCHQNPKSFTWKLILSVSSRGSGRRKERPWQHYFVCDRLPRPRERGRPEMVLRQLLNRTFSFLLSQPAVALRHVLDPALEVVHTSSLCSPQRHLPSSQGL